MKTLFQSMTNKAGCTFGAVSSSCACSLIHALGTVLAVSLFVILVLGLCLLSVCAILVIGLIAGLLATIAVLAVLSVRIIMMVRGVSYPLKRDLPYSDPV